MMSVAMSMTSQPYPAARAHRGAGSAATMGKRLAAAYAAVTVHWDMLVSFKGVSCLFDRSYLVLEQKTTLSPISLPLSRISFYAEMKGKIPFASNCSAL